MNRTYKNLSTALPLGVVLGLWFALADNFHVVISSAKLLGSARSLGLALSYGFLSTMGVTLTVIFAASIIFSLADIRGRTSPIRHAGNVVGGVICLLILIFIYYFIVVEGHLTSIIDPRYAFPMFGLIALGLLLWRLTAAYTERYYKPADWGSLIINHYSITAGVAVFIFGTCAALFGTLKGEVHPHASITLNAENIIYYAIFFISGLIVRFLLRYILSRFSSRPIAPASFILLISIIPLIIFLRPAEGDNPDKHNPAPGNKGKNLLFISVDTLRYDRLGCDFNNTIQTPDIDGLAEDSVIFDNCIVPLPVTVPSHYSMFTGLIPRNHGIRVQASPIDPNLPTITRTLSKAGFTCGGFVSMCLLDGPNSGLDKDFHYYDDFWVRDDESRYFPREVKYSIGGKIINKVLTGRSSTPNRFERNAEQAVDSVMKWLDAVRDDDFFCFLHLFDPHWDYNAPEPYKLMYDPDYSGDMKYHFYLNKSILANELKITEADFKHIVRRYDGEVTYTDNRLGLLFKRLKELGLWDDTMIILTADHGESFGHGYLFNHSTRVYQSTIHVPLIIKPFGNADGERVGQLCSIVDLYPTICDALNLPIPQGLDGVSLTPLIDGTGGEDFQPHQYLFSESYPYSGVSQYIGRIYSINRGTDKLIYSPYAYPFEPTYQFYNIALDPDEEHNMYDPSDSTCDELAKLLGKWVAADTDIINPLWERINLENLRTLQYLK